MFDRLDNMSRRAATSVATLMAIIVSLGLFQDCVPTARNSQCRERT
jgi:hypothetical protein